MKYRFSRLNIRETDKYSEVITGVLGTKTGE